MASRCAGPGLEQRIQNTARQFVAPFKRRRAQPDGVQKACIGVVAAVIDHAQQSVLTCRIWPSPLYHSTNSKAGAALMDCLLSIVSQI
jgi:hypothetical protein